MVIRRTAKTVTSLAALPSTLVQNYFSNRYLRLIYYESWWHCGCGTTRNNVGTRKKPGKTIMLENKPIGQFSLALQALQLAQPEGHFLFATKANFFQFQVIEKMYDAQKSLACVTVTAAARYKMIASDKLIFKTITKFLNFTHRTIENYYAALGFGSIKQIKNLSLTKFAGINVTVQKLQ